MASSSHTFGGQWTTEKLDILEKYLQAYVTALKKIKFSKIYIDAFAGTGQIDAKKYDRLDTLFPTNDTQDVRRFLKGSARIALEVNPPFDKYIFIERNEHRCIELENLKQVYPTLAKNIIIKNEDSNICLANICSTIDWRYNRALLFLDPYGMQVNWSTIQSIAQTKAIDLWYLFSLGGGLNRLLTNNGKIPEKWREKLNSVLGTSDWYHEFYKPSPFTSLFDNDAHLQKSADFKTISNYIVQRLKTEFPAVAESPRLLYNMRNNPLYLFCFAVSNPDPKALRLAMPIANHILKG